MFSHWDLVPSLLTANHLRNSQAASGRLAERGMKPDQPPSHAPCPGSPGGWYGSSVDPISRSGFSSMISVRFGVTRQAMPSLPVEKGCAESDGGAIDTASAP